MDDLILYHSGDVDGGVNTIRNEPSDGILLTMLHAAYLNEANNPPEC